MTSADPFLGFENLSKAGSMSVSARLKDLNVKTNYIVFYIITLKYLDEGRQ